MLSAIAGLLSTVFGWVGGLLPDSPFTQYAVAADSLQLGLAWFNWFVPISEMLVMLGLWIAAMLAVTAVKVALRMTSSVGSKVAGS